jgi:hypothetical protein
VLADHALDQGTTFRAGGSRRVERLLLGDRVRDDLASHIAQQVLAGSPGLGRVVASDQVE